MNAVKAIGNLVENTDYPEAISAAESLERRTRFFGICIPSLIDALRDSSDFVRLTAATAIGNFQAAGSNAIPALLDALSDSSSGVRGNATNALRRISPNALRPSAQ